MADFAAETPQTMPSQLSLEDDQFSNLHIQSFNFPIRPIQDATLPDADQQHCNSDSVPPNKSMHKRARTSINKLPDFSFNPGSSTTQSSQESSQPSLSPAILSAQSSPNRGRRHRRSASEYVGGHSATQSVKVDFRASSTVGSSESPTLAFSFPAQVQDTPELGLPEISQTSDSVLAGSLAAPRASSDVYEISHLHSSPSSHFHDLFDDRVERIPTLHPHACPEREGSSSPPKSDHSTSSDQTASRPDYDTSAALPPNDPLENIHLEQQCSAEAAQSFELEGHGLYQNFDEDPTCVEELSCEEAAQYIPTTFNPTRIGEYSSVPRTGADEVQMIDLDQAFVSTYDDGATNERYTPQGRTFQTARRSMHSSGGMSGFTGPGMHYHRRAESEPLLASFNSEFRPNGFTSNIGMENVFEEEEEEESLCKQVEARDQGVSNESEESNAQNHSGLGITVQDFSPDNATAAKIMEENRSKKVVAQDLSNQVPSQECSSATEEAFEADLALCLPQPTFMTPDTPSGSSFSSPKRLHFNIASSEPSLVLPHSTDDVPSLVSSRSTIASGAIAHQRGTSLRSVTPRLSEASSSGKIEEQQKKRSSIASLSRLIGSSHSDNKSAARSEITRQNSDGIVVLQKSRPAKLRRLFTLWHRKDQTEKE